MIAAGICLMGGCFAQDATSCTVDTYWPAESVAVPAQKVSGSVGLYQYDTSPGLSSVEDCFMETVQYYQSGLASFFYLINGDLPGVNEFIVNAAPAAGYKFDARLQSLDGAFKDLRGYAPATLRISVSNGKMVCDSGESLVAQAIYPHAWAYGETGGRLRILDGRNGEKDFFYSRGDFGQIKWFVHAMRSVTNSVSVFDFNAKVLVEL